MLATVYLNANVAPRVENGHPWVFNNEIDAKRSTLALSAVPGSLVQVCKANGQWIGQGFLNTKSQITVRILSRQKLEMIDDDFFKRRLIQAWNFRQRMGYTENCRLIFGEADLMPGLIIDKFNDYFVIQTLSLGMDLWKQAIVTALHEIFNPLGIYERNDVPVRELEGLPQKKGFLSPPFDPKIIIQEHGVKMYVDLENGQKTGYFLDQQDNRKALQHIAKDAQVLECFSYTGSFGIHAGFYGARSVLGLDVSEAAVALANQNAALNGLEKICQFQAVNAFDVLKKWVEEKRTYDLVILDPPAFTKSRTHIQKAVSGYKEINLRGMKLVKPGGFLVTASCTNLVSPGLFLKTIQQAATDARCSLTQVTYQTQASDHPIRWGQENTEYLKFLIVKVDPLNKS